MQPCFTKTIASTQPQINISELVWQRFEDLWNEIKILPEEEMMLERVLESRLNCIDELKKEIESGKCILITQIFLNEEPVIEFRSSFMEGLEFDAFFQKYQIALEVQGAQHWLHNTSWYKDIEDLRILLIVIRRKDACVKVSSKNVER
ncbi:hypothetical protein Glove_327g7 [Diversispora epigaea]|uniref:Uncharacterized protein n=1 Tax=Diversispora epigaea TaxID=1348612 RepID=A0A397HL97_9GLOM|nr:hypothetical protein Glove_327g7 [Diversispora epigaea]